MFLRKVRVIYRYKPAAWVHVSGADGFTFLQGQFTNDLRALGAVGSSCYNLLINQKGKVVADGFVVRGSADDFWIGSYFSAASGIKERLEAYVVADDVSIADETEAWSGVALYGAEAESLVAPDDGGFVFPGRRGGPALEWIFPRAQEAAVAARLAELPEIDSAEAERRRIDAGIPAVPRDIGPGDLPNEGALERDAISFTKGCYLGQEVMARLKAMGQVRRRLRRVRGTGAPPAAPAALFQGARPAGELRSVASSENGYTGLALLTLLHLDAAAGLSLAPDGPPVLTPADAP